MELYHTNTAVEDDARDKIYTLLISSWFSLLNMAREFAL